MRHAVRFLLISLLAGVPAGTILAHGGGVDALGCHNDRRASQYHCHRGDLSGQTFGSKSEAQAALRGTPTSAPQDGGAEASSGAGVPYDRDLYGGWIDVDGDCQDTRQEVLIAESLEPVTLDGRGCRVLGGRWYDPYTDTYFDDPGELDIDHFVPLREVHQSGGYSWASSRRRNYANDLSDPDTLIAVSASANRSKGGRDPAQWMPPSRAYHCEYVQTWAAIKERWGLGMDRAEGLTLKRIESTCQ